MPGAPVPVPGLAPAGRTQRQGAGEQAGARKPAPPQVTYFNVHLVSDSTGETLNAMMRAVTAQFENIEPVEYSYYLVRSPRQLNRVLTEIDALPGMVWYTISNPELRHTLENFCREAGSPALPVLDPSIHMLSRHLMVSPVGRVAGQHSLDQAYFDRMEAVNFALTHDDGQNLASLRDGDVILTGVSRTSKTPTCIYLANRGVRAGNIPLVPGIPPPPELTEPGGPPVVALRINSERLIQIRTQRMHSMNETAMTDYVDEDAVRSEVVDAARLFQRMDWPVIDVSRRSVEETAAAILNILNRKEGRR